MINIAMNIYAFYTPYVSMPSNDARAGTYRAGSDSPTVIRVYRGWDNVLSFAFRDNNQKPFITSGRSITARMFNSENVEVVTQPLLANPLVDGAATLILGANVTNGLAPALYSLVLEIETDQGQKILAQTVQRSLPRFVIEIIDQTTVSLNQ